VIILIVPVAALLLALVWVNLERRPEREPGPIEQVEAHRRVLRALAPAVSPAVSPAPAPTLTPTPAAAEHTDQH